MELQAALTTALARSPIPDELGMTAEEVAAMVVRYIEKLKVVGMRAKEK